MGRVTVKETNLVFVRPLVEREVTNFLIIHHVGGKNIDFSAAEIHQWHINEGWAGIGYHYVIRKDGTIERGRPRDVIGAQCEGHNWESIGINVVGDFMLNYLTDYQLTSLVNLCADLCEIYGLEPNSIIGHRDKNQTDCPGDNLYVKLPEIRQRVKIMMG